MLACQRGCQRGRRRTAEPRGDARRRTRPAREVPSVVSRNVADARTFVGSAASCAVAARAPRRNQKSRARSPGGIKRRFVEKKSELAQREEASGAGRRLERPSARSTRRFPRREGRKTRNGHDVRERRGRRRGYGKGGERQPPGHTGDVARRVHFPSKSLRRRFFRYAHFASDARRRRSRGKKNGTARPGAQQIPSISSSTPIT